MSSGANVGAQIRGQDIARGEAASRLQMAYAQLAHEEGERDQREHMRMQLADAANALKARQINMLENWHNASIDARREGIAARERQNLADLSAVRPHFGVNGELVTWDPKTQTYTQVVPPRPIPGKKPTLSIPLDPNNPFGAKMTGPADDPDIVAALAKATAPPPAAPPEGPSLGNRLASFLGLGGPKIPAPAAPAMPGEIAPIGTMPPGGLNAPMTSPLMFGGAPGSAAPAAAPVSPFKEGALIRNKKDGKLYRVQNGVPVPEPASAPAASTEPTEADEEAQTQSELPMSDTPQEPEEE